MTVDEAIAYLRKGSCPAGEKRDGCAVCAHLDEAMRTLVAEGALAAFAAHSSSPLTPEQAEAIAGEVIP